MNRLVELWSLKQAFWLDFIRRNLLTSGELKKMVDADGLRGMTSNPTIFEKAISGGGEYDADLKRLALKGLTADKIFEELALVDIRKACDILKPVFKESKGQDGYVSLEVSPHLAYDAEGTLEDAKRLFKLVGRPNAMIKIPGTKPGLAAIEEALFAGVNVNVTLLFSVENYKQVLEAYLRALERRAKKGLPLKGIASVASFFVSRVDTVVDRHLDASIADGGVKADGARALLHRAAIANAKIAYAHYEAVTASPRFQKLAAKGAQVQRLLWASTGAKDKRLSDTIYVDQLIGPDTVNTMPPQTAEAFRDHGTVKETLRDGVDAAKKAVHALGGYGVHLEKELDRLQADGVRLFAESFESLLTVVGAKAEKLTGRTLSSLSFRLGKFKPSVEDALARMESEKWVERIWQKDATLWKADDAHKKIILNSLGWLTVPGVVRQRLHELRAIAADAREAGFTHALLLGMGGSSLCPEVLRLTFGKRPGGLDLAILDSTEPASVIERAQRSRPEKTLYIVASKSGSTTEPNAFFAYFYDLVKKKKGDKAGRHFVAITDPGTQMERIAREKNFRHIVLNPADIGGRYSALSFFGMLPAALMGIDVAELLARAGMMSAACSASIPASKNPGAVLGAVLGTLAREGRDKVTFFLSKDVASFATWVEQLIAESTGKEGRGILPVESEDLRAPSSYKADRVFVWIKTKGADASVGTKLSALAKAGHPVITVDMGERESIAAQFFLWEFATAVAGAVLGIDSFDQPNVQESKDLTKQVLEEYKSNGHISLGQPVCYDPATSVYLPKGKTAASLAGAIRDWSGATNEGDYIAILAYVTRNAANEKALQVIRHDLAKYTGRATTLGFGPRFLHSTGQLHKGGANNGLFLQITAEDPKDLPVPGEKYGFSVLKEAQALGDLRALFNKDRRVVRVHLKHVAKGIEAIRLAIKNALS